jgi:hypothetical protein
MDEGMSTMVHTCNSSYSGGRDQEDHGSKPAWWESISTNKLGIVLCTCHPSYARDINRSITDQTGWDKNLKTLFEK